MFHASARTSGHRSFICDDGHNTLWRRSDLEEMILCRHVVFCFAQLYSYSSLVSALLAITKFYHSNVPLKAYFNSLDDCVFTTEGSTYSL